MPAIEAFLTALYPFEAGRTVVRSWQDAGEEKQLVRVFPANQGISLARSAGLEPATF